MARGWGERVRQTDIQTGMDRHGQRKRWRQRQGQETIRRTIRRGPIDRRGPTGTWSDRQAKGNNDSPNMPVHPDYPVATVALVVPSAVLPSATRQPPFGARIERASEGPRRRVPLTERLSPV